MRLCAKKVVSVGVLGLAAFLGLGAAGRVAADDGGAADSKPAKKDASVAKSDLGGGANPEKKADARAALTERERMLLDRVEMLEKRVEELEAKSGTPKKADEASVDAGKAQSSSTGDSADMGPSNAAPVHKSGS